MKILKTFNPVSACVGVLIWVAVLAGPAAAGTVDRIVAKVDDKIITQSELEERVLMKMMAMRKNNIPIKYSREEILQKELDVMIEETLLLNAGLKRGFTVGEDKLNQAILDIEKNNGLKPGELEKMLQAENKSLDKYKETIREQILMSDIRSYEVRQRVNVGEKDVRKFYDEHIKEFWKPAKLKLRHILFLMGDSLLEEDKALKRKKARAALKRLKAGEDFAVIAKEYSEDISASSGGELGIIERGKMVPEFEKAAFGLKEGKFSDLVETPYGLHIIRVDQIIPGQTIPFNEVQDRLKNQLLQKEFMEEYRAYIQELKDMAFIENKLFPPGAPAAQPAQIKSAGQDMKLEGSPSDHSHQPPVLSRSDKHTEMTSKSEFTRYRTLEDQLRTFKEMRDNREISEEDYQRMKKEMLKHL